MKGLGFKIWFLIIIVLLSLLAIFGPFLTFKQGVLVQDIDSNSSLFEQGLRQGEIITRINEKQITSVEDFSNELNSKFLGEEDVRVSITTIEREYIFYGSVFPEIIVSNVPKTNIKLGLDLAGGSRALVKAENRSLSSEEISDLVDITSNRLNAFGLTDLTVRSVSDLSGNNFMLIEIAGATPKDLRRMVSEQGEFEAKIGNETVFIGGNRDVANVGRDAQNARIESCGPSSTGYVCRFSFSIILSPEAAKRHADMTRNLSVNITPEGRYLSERLDLILDGNLMSSLLIGEGLRGQVTTQIQISGSGFGETEEDALNNAKEEMNQLQTILMTGSLPYKLEIVKLDTISPSLGEAFIKFILLAGVVALLAASVIIFIRYRNWKASGALLISTVSEVIIILGIASVMRWNLDLPSIAGILATLGTGFDDLIILLDESSSNKYLSLKQRIKRAFAIIMGAYLTTLVSLLPLMTAGAGLLRGFAITTIIGISVGVLVTRPAFGEMIKRFKKE